MKLYGDKRASAIPARNCEHSTSAGVEVGEGVNVLVAVKVVVSVYDGVAVGVGVGEDVLVGFKVGVAVAVAVEVGEGVDVSVPIGVFVAVCDGVNVAAGTVAEGVLSIDSEVSPTIICLPSSENFRLCAFSRKETLFSRRVAFSISKKAT